MSATYVIWVFYPFYSKNISSTTIVVLFYPLAAIFLRGWISVIWYCSSDYYPFQIVINLYGAPTVYRASVRGVIFLVLGSQSAMFSNLEK